MKKIFSLVALVGMFALMSFSFKSDRSNATSVKEQANCWQMATSEVDFWMMSPFDPWGYLGFTQYEVGEMMWDAIYERCSAQNYGIEDCVGC